MDSKRFDNWTKNRALRLSRRNALKILGAGGAAAALPTLATEALAQGSCSLTLHAETAAGPSAPQTYDGTLQFTVGPDGTLTQASFTPSTGGSQQVTGYAIGRAIDLQIALPGNQLLSLSGVADRPLTTCQATAAGILSGPQPGDLGGWQATPTTSSPAAPATSNGGSTGGGSGSTTTCPAGQILCGGGCIDPSTDPGNCGGCGIVCDSGKCGGGVCANVSVCTPDGEPCNVPADCCSGLCPHESQAPGICGCSQIGGVCAGLDDCCQQGGDTLVACLGGTNSDRCIVFNGACTSDSDCLNQSCVNGMCGSGGSGCNADGAPCNSATDCCSQSCNFGLCGCAKLGQSCNEDIDFFCCEGAPVICLAGACCIINGSPCSADADCCDYIQANGFCTNGICTRSS